MKGNLRNISRALTSSLFFGFLTVSPQGQGAVPGSTNDGAIEEEIARLEESYQRAKKAKKSLESRLEKLKHGVLNQSEAPPLPSLCQGRLTATSATPVTTADTTANTTVYFTPYVGNLISIYRGGTWKVMAFSEASLLLSTPGTTANTNYDVFGYINLGALTLELGPAWTSATARAVAGALSVVNGVHVLASDYRRRYLGTIRTGATINQFADSSTTTRGIWSMCNRVPRLMLKNDAANSWSYTTNSWRIAGANAANVVNLVIGLDEVLVQSRVKSNIRGKSNGDVGLGSIGIGIDSVTANSAILMGGRGNDPKSYGQVQIWGDYLGYPGAGFHALNWIETAPDAIGTMFFGDNSSASGESASGIVAYYNG